MKNKFLELPKETRINIFNRVADQLGITESTSKSQLSRARSALQKSLIEAEQNLIQKQNPL